MPHTRLPVVVACAALLAGGMALAGEILILQPAPSSSGNRNEEAARQLNDRARQQAGQAVPGTAYVLDPSGAGAVPVDQADQLRQNARDYLDPHPVGTAGDGTQVILRAAPLSEAERLRLKSRTYAAEPAKPTGRNCGAVSNQVGVIGEGAGAQQSENVIEKGGAAVNPQCR